MTSEDLRPFAKRTYQGLEDQAVKLFNAFIRHRDSQEIKDGFVCISCRELKPLSKMHAGHFYSGGHYAVLRFDEENVHGQCHRCNRHLHGNLNEYRINLEKKIGKERIEVLDLKSKARGARMDRWTLIEKIIYYKNKLKNENQDTHSPSRIGHISDGNGSSSQPARKLFQGIGTK